MAGDPTPPTGVVVEIVGIDRGDRGRSCEEHNVCGLVVEEDTLLRLHKEQIMVDGVEETAIACYWVTDGIDCCRIGFLKRHITKHACRFDWALVQVTRVLSDDPCICDTAERKKNMVIMVAPLPPSFLACRRRMKRGRQRRERRRTGGGRRMGGRHGMRRARERRGWRRGRHVAMTARSRGSVPFALTRTWMLRAATAVCMGRRGWQRR